MRILGVDPGATTGWCLYDAASRTVVDCGHFQGADAGERLFCLPADIAVVERLRPHGASYPQVVEAAYTCGRLVEWLFCVEKMETHEMFRDDVRKALQDSVYGAIRVKDDKTVRAALVLLHGEGSDRKATKKNGPGGVLGAVTGHCWAALAVAVAFSLRKGVMAG